eukprot:SAG31_NODE_218_length_19934_cov_81.634837_5_plen_90_part_00
MTESANSCGRDSVMVAAAGGHSAGRCLSVETGRAANVCCADSGVQCEGSTAIYHAFDVHTVGHLAHYDQHALDSSGAMVAQGRYKMRTE